MNAARPTAVTTPKVLPRWRLENLGDIPVVLVEAGLAGECAPEAGNATALFAAVSGPRALIRIPGAAHTDFIDAAGPDCGAGCSLCPASEVDADDVRRFSVETMAALFTARLQDDVSADDAVNAAVDVASAFNAETDFLNIEASLLLGE